MITLTREEAQQLLEVFELFLEEAEDVTTLENNLIKMLRTRLAQPEPEPVAGYRWEEGRTPPSVTYTAPPQRERVQFPTMLRKMWSGTEVQAWLDENVNKEMK
jgi:hypothetical protein